MAGISGITAILAGLNIAELSSEQLQQLGNSVAEEKRRQREAARANHVSYRGFGSASALAAAKNLALVSS